MLQYVCPFCGSHKWKRRNISEDEDKSSEKNEVFYCEDCGKDTPEKDLPKYPPGAV